MTDTVEYKFKPCIELELLDCHCNNCLFMNRDMDKFSHWKEQHRKWQFEDFERNRLKAISDAEESIKNALNDADKRSCEGNLRVALKMKFQFDQEGLINYGTCDKFKKEISFIPNIIQIETQSCFQHRRL